MAIVSLCNGTKPSTTSEVTLYNAGSSGGVQIVRFVASNDTGAASSYNVRIYGTSGTPDHILPTRAISRYKPDTPAALHGVVIPAGGRLAVQVGTANTISFTVAGDV